MVEIKDIRTDRGDVGKVITGYVLKELRFYSGSYLPNPFKLNIDDHREKVRYKFTIQFQGKEFIK